MPDNNTIAFTAAEREQLFEKLYLDMFPRVARYISKRGGSFDEAKDIFQESVVIYYEKMTGSGVDVVQHTDAYLMGIARHLWIKACKGKARLADDSRDADIADSKELSASERVLGFLTVAGQKCMELLHAFYYDKQNMKEVATNFGFSSERSATVQKFKCLEKVRDIVKQRSLVYEDFLD